MTQKQSNNLDAEDRPYHLALFKKGRRRNYAEYLPFRAHGPLITPELLKTTQIAMILFWKMMIRHPQHM